MRRTFTGLACLAAVALMTSGCLDFVGFVKDTTPIIYLEPDGTVTWTVLEQEVRWNGGTPEEGAREDKEFFAAVSAGRHPVALAFGRLNAMDVRTLILRADRPYTVQTEARFARFDRLMARFMVKLGGEAISTLQRQDGTVTWTLTASESTASTASDKDDYVNALGDLFERGQLVLAAGHFTGAVGFDLSSDGRVATIQSPDHQQSDDTDSDKPLYFSLTWTEAENVISSGPDSN